MHILKFTPRENAILELNNLKLKSKFEPDEFYSGLQPLSSIPIANKTLNNSIDRLIVILKDEPSIPAILNEYKFGLLTFEDFDLDTEDREKVCEYYDEIREIIGFDSTNDILNDWLW